MKIFNFILAICLLSVTLKIEAIQVLGRPQTVRIQYERSPQEIKNQQTEATGAALGTVIGKLIRKKCDETRQITETRNQIYVEDMLEEYTPDRHEEYVACIQRSALPKKTKMLVIHQFNKIRRATMTQ